MNFLTHFFFDRRYGGPGTTAAFQFGVAVPDLLIAYDRGLRFSRTRVDERVELFPHSGLWRGVRHHLAVDRFFHGSRFFHDSYDSIRHFLVHHLPSTVTCRRFFLAHLVVEILLDHALLGRDPSLAASFYTRLGQISRSTVRAELESFFERPLPELTAHLDRFMRIRFLEHYAVIEDLHEPVNRMLQRTRQEPIPADYLGQWRSLMVSCRQVILANLPALVDEADGGYPRV
jgi:hypothetical protein